MELHLSNRDEWLNRFMTSALPTKLTDQQLAETGFRKYSEISFIVNCADYPSCNSFLKSYHEAWWITLGKSFKIKNYIQKQLRYNYSYNFRSVH